MQNAKLVSSSKPKVSGAVSRGPLGTTLPTDATSALEAAMKSQGYLGDAGIKMKPERKSEKTRAFGGDPVHVAQTEAGEVWTFTLIESSNAEVLKTIAGEENVTITAGATPEDPPKIHVKHNSQELDHSAWCIDVVNRGRRPRRITIADGFISDIGDISYSDKDIIAYQLSIDALPDENGDFSNEYIG